MGVDAKEVDPLLCRAGFATRDDVHSDADGEKSESFQKLEHSDEHEASRMLVRRIRCVAHRSEDCSASLAAVSERHA